MEARTYGQVLAKGFVQAIPWAIVFSAVWLVTFNLTMGMVRQELKEAIEYAAKTGVSQTVQTILHDPTIDRDLWPKFKQNTKEAIEYTAVTAARELAASARPQGRK